MINIICCVVRGGQWFSVSYSCRSDFRGRDIYDYISCLTFRFSYYPNFNYNTYGVRLVFRGSMELKFTPRTLRGNSQYYLKLHYRSAYRNSGAPSSRYYFSGFRLCYRR